jgi:hypothetical protein
VIPANWQLETCLGRNADGLGVAIRSIAPSSQQALDRPAKSVHAMAETSCDGKAIARVTGKLYSILVQCLGIQPLGIFPDGDCDDYNPYQAKSNIAVLMFLLPTGIVGCLLDCCSIYWPRFGRKHDLFPPNKTIFPGVDDVYSLSGLQLFFSSIST